MIVIRIVSFGVCTVSCGLLLAAWHERTIEKLVLQLSIVVFLTAALSMPRSEITLIIIIIIITTTSATLSRIVPVVHVTQASCSNLSRLTSQGLSKLVRFGAARP